MYCTLYSTLIYCTHISSNHYLVDEGKNYVNMATINSREDKCVWETPTYVSL